ncbi:asparagine synthase (glutamine-hydrolyzing) [Methylosinus sporium]|uniref:asparagine synthase (glutamine-hydrolyzing) n=1 Tax=Methylosinus sporium TaxID=428 RepID=A0A2U1STZ7_METSR|nr:asparagine synthase (glutamine-hydrolyzing) [Methylosinus sporium]PWB95078.1 asparagine synthase (glutamine-hydrolyzing) [Methylosinus sporium]
MCGIVGYLGADAASGRQFAERGGRLLQHRGLDDEGVFAADGVVLGFRRLSIVDLTAAGHQPMTSPDGRYTLIYNGEVYNHEDLRPRLSNRWQFSSRCDTETVLAALAQEGPAALERMVGMWALALWDAVDRRLLLSRDRYGQKPLYWRKCDDGSLRFASEIAPLIDAGERPKLYAPAMAEFLAVGSYGHLGERTFFRDIRSFPPGHWAWIDNCRSEIEPRRYWRFPVCRKQDQRPLDDYAARQFREAFLEAVGSQMVADVPIAATLSGGLDSSAVVGAMALSKSNGRIRAFTAQARGTAYDESSYVAAVGELWGDRLEIEALAVETMSLSILTEAVVVAQEEPFGDPSIIAHDLITRAVRKSGITVLLGGQGGDELLLGYPHFSPAVVASELRGGRRYWALREMTSLGMGSGALIRIGASAIWPTLERSMRRRSKLNAYHWLSPALREAAWDLSPHLAALSHLDGVWLENIEKLALPHLVHYDDRNCMRHSIEGRMPFLDHRLADVVAGFEPQAFLDHGRRKNLLRHACGDLLPDIVRSRNDKIGFHTPLTELMAAEIEWVQELVCGEEARASELFDTDWISSRCEALRHRAAGPADVGRVWRALVATIWTRAFSVDCDVVADRQPPLVIAADSSRARAFM